MTSPAILVIAICAVLAVLSIVLIVWMALEADQRARWAAESDWTAEIRERDAGRHADLEMAARAAEAADGIGGAP